MTPCEENWEKITLDTSYSRELALFFDRLRLERGMSQLDFIFGIVSIRQYRRYLSGDSMIPQDIVGMLAKKLGFKPEHIIMDFEAVRIEESKRVTAYYNAVINNDEETLAKMEGTIDLDKVIDRNNRLIFEFATWVRMYRQKKINESDLVARIKAILHYPAILSMARLSSAEVILMSTLLIYRSFNEKPLIADKLTSYVADTSQVISGYNERIRFLCLQHLADYRGTLGDFPEVIRLSKFAIDGLVGIKSYYLMEFFYYYMALAHYYQGETEQYKDAIYRCHAILEAENNPAKSAKFKKRIEDDFHISLPDFIKDYVNSH
jgi:hypothetical protein